MSPFSLQTLKNNRDALLLAEALGWLHDYRKCSEEHLQAHSPGSKAQALPRTELARRYPNLQNINLSILTTSQTVVDLLNDRTRAQDWLGQLLSRCHHTAHFDKQKPIDGEQNYPGVQISSPFGFEQPVAANLTASLWNLPWNYLGQVAALRQNLQEEVSTLFARTVADTRRPINEVDLWSWGMLVGALYKAALAGALLTGSVPSASNLRWRLLVVRVDGLEYISTATRIPDLMARKELLVDGLNRVRELLEVTYPLGTEVYRDENGSVYIVPDIADLLNSTHSGTTLQSLILNEFAQGTTQRDPGLRIDGEIVPYIELEPTPWWGQDPNWPNSSNDELPNIRDLLAKKFVLSASPNEIHQYWGGKVADVCPVCGVRPQGPSSKARERKVCDICEQRRANRAQEWAQGSRQDTIWLDEVADTNGRLALVVGQFGLDDWLSGKLVQTMLVMAEANNPTGCVPKNPSPTRLRRIWETTQRFWQTALQERDAQGNPLIPPARGRWRITPQNPMPSQVAAYHTYDLLLNGRRLSVLWDGGEFITCDNLAYFEKIASVQLQDLLQPGSSYELWTPAGYGERTSKVAEVTIGRARQDSTSYTPAIPILAEPRTFMALVPANRALKVVMAIKAKYEREMGKVRNRLPLTLGVVYLGRRTPLAAAMETGRQMLKRPVAPQVWEVTSKNDGNPLSTGWPSVVRLTLQQGDRQISLSIPTVMGDGTTPDVWYPYWRVEGKPTDRTRWFVGPDGEHWVHVTDLRPGDRVGFMPSTFDFEYLDTTARRFEVIYDGEGRRRGAEKRQRPYLLEEMETLEAVWQEVCKLTTSQILQVEMLIGSKRQAWGEPRGTLQVSPTFRQFVQDALREAGIQSGVLEQAALRGMLSDALEIHMIIH